MARSRWYMHTSIYICDPAGKAEGFQVLEIVAHIITSSVVAPNCSNSSESTSDKVA